MYLAADRTAKAAKGFTEVAVAGTNHLFRFDATTATPTPTAR